MVALSELMMAKKKRNDVPVKIDAEVIADARLIAAHTTTPIAELLSEILRPILAKRVQEVAAEIKARGKKP